MEIGSPVAGVEQLHSNCCVLTSKPTVIFWDILLGRGYDAHEHDFWNLYYTISTATYVLHQPFITLNNGVKMRCHFHIALKDPQ